MELSDFEKTDKLLNKMENAYNQALGCQTIHSAAQIVEIQECLAALIPSQPKRLHLIGVKMGEIFYICLRGWEPHHCRGYMDAS